MLCQKIHGSLELLPEQVRRKRSAIHTPPRAQTPDIQPQVLSHNSDSSHCEIEEEIKTGKLSYGHIRKKLCEVK